MNEKHGVVLQKNVNWITLFKVQITSHITHIAKLVTLKFQSLTFERKRGESVKAGGVRS